MFTSAWCLVLFHPYKFVCSADHLWSLWSTVFGNSHTNTKHRSSITWPQKPVRCLPNWMRCVWLWLNVGCEPFGCFRTDNVKPGLQVVAVTNKIKGWLLWWRLAIGELCGKLQVHIIGYPYALLAALFNPDFEDFECVCRVSGRNLAQRPITSHTHVPTFVNLNGLVMSKWTNGQQGCWPVFAEMAG